MLSRYGTGELFGFDFGTLPPEQDAVGRIDEVLVNPKGGAVQRLQTERAAEMDALLPAVLDRTFKG